MLPIEAKNPTDTSTPPRLRRFIREPEKLESRQLTEKGLEMMAAIERHRFLSSSMAVRLVDGGQRNNYRHLQTLFHKGLVNRFALPTLHGRPGEFVYFHDALSSFRLLIDKGLIAPDDAESPAPGRTDPLKPPEGIQRTAPGS